MKIESQKSTTSFLNQSIHGQRSKLPKSIKLEVSIQLNLIMKRTITTIIIIIPQKKKQMLKQPQELLLSTEQSNFNVQLEKGSAESQNTRENRTISICSFSRLPNTNFVNKINYKSQKTVGQGQSKTGLEGNSIQAYKILIEQILRDKSKLFDLQNTTPQTPKKESNKKRVPIFKEITLEHYLSIFLKGLREVRPRLVDLFHSYLSSDKKIYRFLQHLYYSYPIETVSKLLQYEFYIWELYYPYLGSSLTILEAEEMGLKISHKIVDGILEAREKKNLQKLDREYLLNLMIILTQATIFIMEDFEMDSLMQQQSSRRPPSEQDENDNPRKMIKQNQ